MRIEHTRAMALEMQKLHSGSVITAAMSYAVPEKMPFQKLSKADAITMRSHIERVSKTNNIPEAAVYAFGHLRLREDVLRQVDPFAYSMLTYISEDIRYGIITTGAKKFEPKKLLKNPYLQNIGIPEVNCGGVFTKKMRFEEFEPFTFKEPSQHAECMTLFVPPGASFVLSR